MRYFAARTRLHAQLPPPPPPPPPPPSQISTPYLHTHTPLLSPPADCRPLSPPAFSACWPHLCLSAIRTAVQGRAAQQEEEATPATRHLKYLECPYLVRFCPRCGSPLCLGDRLLPLVKRYDYPLRLTLLYTQYWGPLQMNCSRSPRNKRGPRTRTGRMPRTCPVRSCPSRVHPTNPSRWLGLVHPSRVAVEGAQVGREGRQNRACTEQRHDPCSLAAPISTRRRPHC